MKKLVKVEEIKGEGLEGLMGETITLYCLNYIYTGELVGVNNDFVKLDNPKIVYDTGSHETKDWGEADALPNSWYVQKSTIESFGVFK